jgi:phosphoribosyl-ATP pyrophosphohydrolase
MKKLNVERLRIPQDLRLQDVMDRLWNSLDAHFRASKPVPERTAKLAAGGCQKMAKKLVEEAGEAALAAAAGNRGELIAESADLLYHLTVLWASLGVQPEDVWQEMAEREAAYGLAEKRAKRAAAGKR